LHEEHNTDKINKSDFEYVPNSTVTIKMINTNENMTGVYECQFKAYFDLGNIEHTYIESKNSPEIKMNGGAKINVSYLLITFTLMSIYFSNKK